MPNQIKEKIIRLLKEKIKIWIRPYGFDPRQVKDDFYESLADQILELFEQEKQKCQHKWEDLAVINYPPETSIICNRCGKSLIKGRPKNKVKEV